MKFHRSCRIDSVLYTFHTHTVHIESIKGGVQCIAHTDIIELPSVRMSSRKKHDNTDITLLIVYRIDISVGVCSYNLYCSLNLIISIINRRLAGGCRQRIKLHVVYTTSICHKLKDETKRDRKIERRLWGDWQEKKKVVCVDNNGNEAIIMKTRFIRYYRDRQKRHRTFPQDWFSICMGKKKRFQFSSTTNLRVIFDPIQLKQICCK